MTRDTAATWKRRALRAEQRAAFLEQMIDTLQQADRTLLYRLVDARVALDEIAETMARYQQAQPTNPPRPA